MFLFFINISLEPVLRLEVTMQRVKKGFQVILPEKVDFFGGGWFYPSPLIGTCPLTILFLDALPYNSAFIVIQTKACSSRVLCGR